MSKLNYKHLNIRLDLNIEGNYFVYYKDQCIAFYDQSFTKKDIMKDELWTITDITLDELSKSEEKELLI